MGRRRESDLRHTEIQPQTALEVSELISYNRPNILAGFGDCGAKYNAFCLTSSLGALTGGVGPCTSLSCANVSSACDGLGDATVFFHSFVIKTGRVSLAVYCRTNLDMETGYKAFKASLTKSKHRFGVEPDIVAKLARAAVSHQQQRDVARRAAGLPARENRAQLFRHARAAVPALVRLMLALARASANAAHAD